MPARKQQKKSSLPPYILIAGFAVILIAAAAILIGAQPKAAAGLPSQVSVAQAAELRDNGAFILDVREPEEWADFHIPGSTHIPLAQLAQRVSEVPDDQEIVVVCRSGNRSQTGRDILKQAGYEDVTSMSGGLLSWRSSGYPTVSGP